MRVNEGDGKNKQKNLADKIFPVSRNKLVFFPNVFFILSKLTVFFGNRQQSNARAGQKKNLFFLVMRGLNLMRALI